ncbi:sensor histidine kinase [Actinomadura mexicana]|uniref:Signal transduction histidine kinase n=1 Tax=Actinomadura mexicana TaxID=134959 RepID=A0A238WQ88_9ACTN|nr:histidine kinase [Actinomadura mexicana]SNR48695.1 Signal transduction histidine kinase [Actinomadura mexicana]
MAATPNGDRAPRLARAQFALCVGLIAPYKIAALLSGGQGGYPRPGAAAVALGVCAIVVLYPSTIAAVLRRPPRPWAVPLVGGQAVLAYGPYAVVGGAFPAVSALLMATLMLVFTGRARWAAAALVPAAEFLVRTVWLPSPGVPHPLYFALWATVATAVTGVLLFAVGRLAYLVGELHDTRSQLASLESARERLRIARGLRTALGERLTVVLRTARRAAEPDAAAAAERIARLARRALTGVRSVADDHADRSLAAEVAGARSVLAAAGVPVTADAPPAGPHGDPARRGDAALAAILRRTVITALREGTPRSCRIGLGDPGRLRVAFAGLPQTAFGGLADAVAELGGKLETGTSGDEVYAEVRLPDDRHRTPPRLPVGPVAAAPWLAWGVLLAYEIDFIATTLLNMLGNIARATPAQFAAAAVLLPSVALLQLHHVVPRPGGAQPGAWRWTLLLQVLLVGAALAVLGESFPPQYTGMIAGVVLFHLRPPLSWAIAAPLVCAPLPLLYGIGHPPSLYFALASSAFCMVAVHALCRLPLVARRLDDARRELARTAVVRERLRIARDVHDLLGFQLSAIALKGELAGRLAAADPRAALRQLAELAEEAERALSTVRSITRDATGLSLRDEVEAARSMLAAAGAETRLSLDDMPATAPGPLLAILLREAVTNVVRHSRASTCEIEVCVTAATVRLRVTNDGVLPGSSGRRGTGLANLEARTAEAGGRLTVRREDDSFTLISELPAALALAS